MTLNRLAKQTGFSKGYLSRVEKSDNAPRFPPCRPLPAALVSPSPPFLEKTPGRPPWTWFKRRDAPYVGEPLGTEERKRFMGLGNPLTPERIRKRNESQ